MSSKKNLPNIPLYIGDWERDCNVLDISSEGAWLRIVFKMWLKGKQSTIKVPTKSLQKLWRCSMSDVKEILEDLKDNEVADIRELEGFTQFTCRRFEKENSISNIRSKASKGISNAKQTLNKSEQNTDNDNDNDYDNEIKNKKEILSAYEFLKENDAQKIEVFEMQNKKSFTSYEVFIINFNSKCVNDEIEFTSAKLYARLLQLNANWNKKDIIPAKEAVLKKIRKYD